MLLLQDNFSIQIQDLVANMAFKIITNGNSVVTPWYACNACNILTGSCGLKTILLPLANVKKKSRQISPSIHLVSKGDLLKQTNKQTPQTSYILFT